MAIKKMPRVVVIHDVVGIGRCSMSVILPVLSAMGVQACPVVTAVFSEHTGYPSPVKYPLTEAMRAILEKYSREHIAFDAVYSGYLGDEEQSEIALDFLRQSKGLKLVDPVMADDGKLYSTMTPAMVEGMRRLASCADILTPNLTEAAFLLGKEPVDALDEDQEKEWLRALAAMGPRTVLITSCYRKGQETVGVGIIDQGVFSRVEQPKLQSQFPGTGDLFDSVLLGGLLRGETTQKAAQRAASFVHDVMKHTLDAGAPPIEGVLLEWDMARLLQGDTPL